MISTTQEIQNGKSHSAALLRHGPRSLFIYFETRPVLIQVSCYLQNWLQIEIDLARFRACCRTVLIRKMNV